jgi:hypothetical protein
MKVLDFEEARQRRRLHEDNFQTLRLQMWWEMIEDIETEIPYMPWDLVLKLNTAVRRHMQMRAESEERHDST